MSFGNLAGPISAGALLDAFGGPSQGPGPYKPAIVSFFQHSEQSLTVSTSWALRLLLLHCWSLLSVSVPAEASGERYEGGREPGFLFIPVLEAQGQHLAEDPSRQYA
jgi:hypothetical protein